MHRHYTSVTELSVLVMLGLLSIEKGEVRGLGWVTVEELLLEILVPVS